MNKSKLSIIEDKYGVQIFYLTIEKFLRALSDYILIL